MYMYLHICVYVIYDAYVREEQFVSWIENSDASLPSLEWVQNSPPLSHTYNELPYVCYRKSIQT